ncbi:MAG: ribonuclease III [Lachnospiraceae bacterium]|nr:ribonuclease III [Lachnospiraceae bacterium]
MTNHSVKKIIHKDRIGNAASSVKAEIPGPEKLEEIIGYHFRSPSILTQALTHTSYANEHRAEGAAHNERIEFLGDAVLEICSSEYLYRTYPEKPEGELTRMRASMVCEPTLALCAKEFGLPAFLRLGRGEELGGGRERDSIVSDALEALIGAIYLDGGFEAARAFVSARILNDIENKRLFVDSKTLLQEYAQGRGESVAYRLEGEEGPDHDKRYYVTVSIGGECAARGCGHSKKAAEQQAAYQALRQLREG